MKTIHYFCWLILLTACTSKHDLIEQSKEEIIQTEKAFDAMAQKEGLAKAFSAFASEDAVICRKNSIISGKSDIFNFYNTKNFENVKLHWKPDSVYVSSSCDLGYTYGEYSFNTVDSTGKELSIKGVFHTVWKKQNDSTWKFVWD